MAKKSKLYPGPQKTPVKLTTEGAAWVPQDTSPAADVEGMITSHIGYGELTGMPENIDKGDVVILTTKAADFVVREMPQFCKGVTILCPNTGPNCKRDAAGKILSIGGFFRR